MLSLINSAVPMANLMANLLISFTKVKLVESTKSFII